MKDEVKARPSTIDFFFTRKAKNEVQNYLRTNKLEIIFQPQTISSVFVYVFDTFPFDFIAKQNAWWNHIWDGGHFQDKKQENMNFNLWIYLVLIMFKRVGLISLWVGWNNYLLIVSATQLGQISAIKYLDTIRSHKELNKIQVKLRELAKEMLSWKFLYTLNSSTYFTTATSFVKQCISRITFSLHFSHHVIWVMSHEKRKSSFCIIAHYIFSFFSCTPSFLIFFLQLLLAVGTKLQHVITQLAHEVAEKHIAIEGELIVQPSDEHFWFGKPKFVLFLIHFILFQNAFEMAFFFWIWVCWFFDPLRTVWVKLKLGIERLT